MFQHWLFFALIAAGVVVVMVMTVVAERKRREALQRVAAQLGLTFYAKDPGILIGGAGSLYLFDQGHSRRVQNVMTGVIEDLQVSVFDYQYTTGGGKNSTTHSQSVVAIRQDGRPLPAFQLRPEGIFHKLGSMLGFNDIDFPEHPRFSSQFLLKGQHELAVRAAFTPEVIGYLEGRKDICVEGGGNWVIVYRSGRRLIPEQIAGFVEEGFTIATGLVPGDFAMPAAA